jgi:hypothetical protein
MTEAHGLYALRPLLPASAEGYIALQQKENPLEMPWVIGF